MQKKISKMPFKGTPEQAAQLQAVIAECKGDNSRLMHVMQQAQAIYGYLPIEVQAEIAEGMAGKSVRHLHILCAVCAVTQG